jgi:probable addiction module antidote protein
MAKQKKAKKTTRKPRMRAVDVDASILESLSDPQVAAAYIRECLSDASGPERSKLLLQALMDVARAQGIQKLAKGSETRRRMIYKSLSDQANPSLSTLESILLDMGLTIDVQPLKRAV